MHTERLDYLFNAHIYGTINQEEENEFKILLAKPELQDRIEELIGDLMENVPGVYMPEVNIQDTLQAIFEANRARVIPMRRKKGWMRIAAAAAVLLILSAGTYFLFFSKPVIQQPVVQNELPNDVKAPATNRAMIMLANGQKVFLDSAVNGKLADEGAVSIVKLADGQISYKTGDSLTTHHSLLTNTLTNPRGSQAIKMTLADGSRVWLNAESAITYPVVFAGNERKVSITGEAYFEIAHNATKPFLVSFTTPSGNEAQVQVLGTHFNINAYADEPSLRITLLEGAIRIMQNAERQTMKPGDQARIINNQLTIFKNADVEQAIAWKNGRFQFEGAGIEEVMRQLARWYNVEVKYEGPVPQNKFNGKIGKSLTLDQLLKGLATTGIQYRIEGGNRITITK